MRPTDEGTTTATGGYQILSQEATVLQLGGGEVVAAQKITVRETVFDTVFSFTLPQATYLGIGPQVAAADHAAYVQQIGFADHVVGMDYAQDTTITGLLYDALVVVVGTDDLLNTTEVLIDMRSLNTVGAFQKIADAWAVIAASLTAGH